MQKYLNIFLYKGTIADSKRLLQVDHQLGVELKNSSATPGDQQPYYMHIKTGIRLLFRYIMNNIRNYTSYVASYKRSHDTSTNTVPFS